MPKKYNYSILSNAIRKRESRKIKIILGSIIVGLVCILVSCFFSTPWRKSDNWRMLVNEVLSTVATVAFAGVAWEGLAKYSFSRDVIDMVGISDKIVESGVFTIEESFSDIQWNELIEGAKSIKAVITYSTRWGLNNSSSIKKAVSNNCSFVVAFPDINSPGMRDVLKYRFIGVDIEAKISDAVAFYRNLGAEIKYYSKAITSSYYLIDDVGIIAPFNHQKPHGGHSPSVPAFVSCKHGYIYRFIEREIDAILTPESPTSSSDKPESEDHSLFLQED